MNYMFSFKKKDIDNQHLPAETGIYLFKDMDSVLYVGRSANLQKAIVRLLHPSQDEKEVFQLTSLTTDISYQTTDNLFSALLEEKALLDKYSPKFNKSFKLHEHYVYLAVDFYHVPFLHLTDSTSENFYYLGPFQKRFFVYDFIDTMADIFQYPACENETYPCSRLKAKTCSGWCLKDKIEIGKILLDSYMKTNEDLPAKLKKEIESNEADLEFTKAEKLKQKLAIIRRYNNYITFFHVTKHINYELSEAGRTIKLENGMISEVMEKGKYQNYPVFNPEYRENELLAHDKTQFAERWIVYNHIKKINPGIIKDLYNKAQLEFNNIFSGKETKF